ncbi:MAG: hypothetical protein EX270_11125 [Pseudomonadales bacterium]|nr:MAG: hypothetical protein EX270_11125 [Pseudomonadales bacterium]
MKIASKTKLKDLVVGDKVQYSGLSYDEISDKWSPVVKTGTVTELKTSKTGRIKASIDNRSFSHNPCDPNSYLQA